jgi:hypothetical protein
MKKNFKWKIIHPFLIEEEEIEVTLKICILYNGIPYGPSYIEYKDPDDYRYSFKGVGIFNDGKLHEAPFACFEGEGYGRLYSCMRNGRIPDGEYFTYFYPDYH